MNIKLIAGAVALTLTTVVFTTIHVAGGKTRTRSQSTFKDVLKFWETKEGTKPPSLPRAKTFPPSTARPQSPSPRKDSMTRPSPAPKPGRVAALRARLEGGTLLARRQSVAAPTTTKNPPALPRAMSMPPSLVSVAKKPTMKTLIADLVRFEKAVHGIVTAIPPRNVQTYTVKSVEAANPVVFSRAQVKTVKKSVPKAAKPVVLSRAQPATVKKSVPPPPTDALPKSPEELAIPPAPPIEMGSQPVGRKPVGTKSTRPSTTGPDAQPALLVAIKAGVTLKKTDAPPKKLTDMERLQRDIALLNKGPRPLTKKQTVQLAALNFELAILQRRRSLRGDEDAEPVKAEPVKAEPVKAEPAVRTAVPKAPPLMNTQPAAPRRMPQPNPMLRAIEAGPTLKPVTLETIPLLKPQDSMDKIVDVIIAQQVAAKALAIEKIMRDLSITKKEAEKNLQKREAAEAEEWGD